MRKDSKPDREVVGIVIARSGSKGIPGKNLKPLGDIPLIAWSIKAALEAQSVTRVIVSTDSEEIAAVAREFGAETPFIRPEELALDDVPSTEPYRHALEYLLETEKQLPDYAILLQPTSPFRSAEDIDNALDILQEQDGVNLISLSEVTEHPYYAINLDQQGKATDFMGFGLREIDRKYPQRQDLPPVYRINGALYIAEPENYLAKQTFYDPQPYGYVMPASHSLDIDRFADFSYAELMIKQTSQA